MSEAAASEEAKRIVLPLIESYQNMSGLVLADSRGITCAAATVEPLNQEPTDRKEKGSFVVYGETGEAKWRAP
jgi:hypothetical protein